MGRRSFAGFACEQTLSLGLFGECFRARNARGQEARVVVVDDRLAARPGFATALARYGANLGDLVHPHVITTKTVGRGKDGSLVVIASAVDQPFELRTLLDQHGGTLPQPVALAIFMGAVRGLSHAHERGVVHGGVHPRSVLVDDKGIAKVGDFGLARALASAAAEADDSELLAGLRGYVAPELALGQDPDVATDVYAAGALAAQLFWGEPVPPAQGGALANLVARALSTDTSHRFRDAMALEVAMRQAIQSDGLQVASASEVSRYLAEQHRAFDEDLDAETEGLLSSLVDPAVAANPIRQSTALKDALLGLEAEFAGLEDSVDVETELADPTASAAKAAVPAAVPIDYSEEHTTVDDSPPEDDSISKIIRFDSESKLSTAAPATTDYREIDETPLPPPRPFDLDGTQTLHSDRLLADAVARRTPSSLAIAGPSPEELMAGASIIAPKRNGLRWLAVIAFVVASVAVVAYTTFDGGKERVKQRKVAAAEAEIADRLARKQPKPGELHVTSAEENAAVWLLLGRTPVESLPLPSSMVHELRVEHEGYLPIFLQVTAQHWSGDSEHREAHLSATLVAGEAKTPLPAYAPEPEVAPAAGGPGRGVVRVDSDPAGSQVWLLVGFTPEVSLTGIESGKDYEFKILKEGFRPAFAAFKAADWYLSGSDGPVKPSLVASVTLEAAAETASEPSPAEGKRRRRKGKRR